MAKADDRFEFDVGDRIRTKRFNAAGIVVVVHHNGWITVQWDEPLCDGSEAVSDIRHDHITKERRSER